MADIGELARPLDSNVTESAVAEKVTPYTGSANFKGVAPEFMDSFEEMSQEYYDMTGKQLKVNDAFRTREQQAEGYRRKPNLVAPPGHSLHEKGLAMDIDETQANELHDLGLLDEFGFTRPMMTKAPGHKYEPWHIQLTPAENLEKKMNAVAGPAPAGQTVIPTTGAVARPLDDTGGEKKAGQMARPLGAVARPLEEGQPSIFTPDTRSFYTKAVDFFKEALAPGTSDYVTKAKTEFMKQHPTATEDEIKAAHAQIDKNDKDERATLSDNMAVLGRNFASSLLAAPRGLVGMALSPFENLGQRINAVHRKLGIDSKYGPVGYGTEGEPAPERSAIDKWLKPEDEKQFSGKRVPEALGNIVGTVAPYTVTSRLAGMGGMALTPEATFAEKLAHNVVSFLPVDAGRMFQEGGWKGVHDNLWQSPTTAALFTIGGIPSGRVTGTVGVGLAGAGAAALAGERDTDKLAEAAGTMAVLHNIMGVRPEKAKAEVEEFVKGHNLTEEQLGALKDKLSAVKWQYEQSRAEGGREEMAGMKEEMAAGKQKPMPSPGVINNQIETMLREYKFGQRNPLLEKTLDPDVLEKIKNSPGGPIRELAPDEVDKIHRALVSFAELGDEGVVPMYSVGPSTNEWFSRAYEFMKGKLSEKGTGEGLANTIDMWSKKGVTDQQGNAIKGDELKWTGLLPWLREQKGPVSKQQVLDFLKENQVEVREVEKGSGIPRELTHEQYARLQELQAKVETENITIAEANEYNDLNSIFSGFADGSDLTKFQSWMKLPPGGENYREVLLGVPGVAGQVADKFEVSIYKGNDLWTRFDSKSADEVEGIKSRFADEPNTRVDIKPAGRVLPAFNVPSSHSYGDPAADVNRFAHVFMDDRVIDGKKYLTVWELQAGDWRNARLKAADAQAASEGLTGDAAKKRASELFKSQDTIGGIPAFPFQNNGMEVSLKKVLRKAAEEGYDGVAWATGDMVKDRYDLSKQVDRINAYKNPDGTWNLGILDKSGNIHENKPELSNIKPEKLQEVVGKDLADKIIKETGERVPSDRDDYGTDFPPDAWLYEGEDLKVGGEWANRQYDGMMPQFLGKYGKQWGARVSEGEIGRKPKHINPYLHLPEGWEVEKTRDGQYLVYDEARHPFGDTHETANDAWKAALDILNDAAKTDAAGTNQPIHTLDITPQMKESIITKGQSMYSVGPETNEWFKNLYKKWRESSPTGAELASTYTKNKGEAAIIGGLAGKSFDNKAEGARDAGTANASVEMPPMEAAVRFMKSYWGERRQEINRARIELNQFKRGLGRLDSDSFLKLLREDVSNYQRSGVVSDQLKDVLAVYDRLRAPFEDFAQTLFGEEWGKEFYFREMFKAPKGGWEKWFSANRTTIEGPKGFLKQSKYPTWAEALDKGLQPKKSNIVDIIREDLEQKSQFMFGHRLMEAYLNMGVIEGIPKGDKLPAGMRYIEGPTGRMTHPKYGQYVAEKGVANLINGQLHPGLMAAIDNSIPSAAGRMVVKGLVKGWNGATNAIRMVEVFGPWHAFTTDNHMRGALMGNVPADLLASIVGKADTTPGKSVAAALAPGSSIVLNRKVAKVIQDTWFRGEGPDWARDAAFNVTEAGGDIHADPRKIVSNLMKGSDQYGNILKDAFVDIARDLRRGRVDRVLSDLIHGGSAPIMKYMVPDTKVTTHYLLTKEPLDRLKANYEVEGVGKDAKTKDSARQKDYELERMRINQDTWKFVDYTFGQIPRENVMIHNVFKDLCNFAIQFPTWNYGNIGLMGKAAEGVGRTAIGQKPDQLSRQALRLATGLLITEGIKGALIHRAVTGQWPVQFKDVYFPVLTQEDREKGIEEERSVSPSYLKTAYAWIHKPGESFVNLRSHTIGMLDDLYHNTTWNNMYIRTPGAGWAQHMKEVGLYLGEKKPFMMQQLEKGETPLTQYGQFVGQGKAPKYLTSTDAEDIMHQQQGKSTFRRTRAEDEIYQVKQKVQNLLRQGKDNEARDLVDSLVDSGKLNPKKADAWWKEAEFPKKVAQFRRLPLETQLDAFIAGTEDEKDLYEDALIEKVNRAYKSDPFTYDKLKEKIEKAIGKPDGVAKEEEHSGVRLSPIEKNSAFASLRGVGIQRDDIGFEAGINDMKLNGSMTNGEERQIRKTVNDTKFLAFQKMPLEDALSVFSQAKTDDREMYERIMKLKLKTAGPEDKLHYGTSVDDALAVLDKDKKEREKLMMMASALQQVPQAGGQNAPSRFSILKS